MNLTCHRQRIAGHNMHNALVCIYISVLMWLVLSSGNARAEPGAGIIDFCDPSAKAAEAGNLVLFPLSGEDVAHAPEREIGKHGEIIDEYYVLSDIDAFSLVENVFYHRFPMRRHNTVVVRHEAPIGLRNAARVLLSEFQQAADGDPFAVYSLGCADWVAIPNITRREATWQRVVKRRYVKGRTVPYTAWELKIDVQLVLRVFARTAADQFTFTGQAFANSAAFGAGVNESAARVSDRPADACFEDAGPGMSIRECARDFSIAPEQQLDCVNVKDSVRNPDAMVQIALCEIRSAAIRAIGALQVSSKTAVSGWRLSAQLQQVPGYGQDTFGIRLGRYEGVRRGDTYLVIDRVDGTDSEETLGWGRVTKVGPGGDSGTTRPSRLQLRQGSAKPGDQVREYPMFGAALGAGVNNVFFYSSEDAASYVVGPTISIGKDVSPWIPFGDEFWTRAYLSWGFGAKTLVYRLEYVAEAKFYHNKIDALYVAGLGLEILGVAAETDKVMGSGSSGGLVAFGGAEYMVSPHIKMRGLVKLHQHGGDISLEDDYGRPIGNAGGSGIELNVAAFYEF